MTKGQDEISPDQNIEVIQQKSDMYTRNVTGNYYMRRNHCITCVCTCKKRVQVCAFTRVPDLNLTLIRKLLLKMFTSLVWYRKTAGCTGSPGMKAPGEAQRGGNESATIRRAPRQKHTAKQSTQWNRPMELQSGINGD